MNAFGPYQPMPIPAHPGIEAQKQTAQNTAAMAAQMAVMQRELEQVRQEVEELKAQQHRQHHADVMQREIDEKKNRHLQFISAAFSVGFTLFLEHIPDVIHFFQALLKALFAFQ